MGTVGSGIILLEVDVTTICLSGGMQKLPPGMQIWLYYMVKIGSTINTA